MVFSVRLRMFSEIESFRLILMRSLGKVHLMIYVLPICIKFQ